MQSLRGVTLPDDDVLDLIDDRFVLATRNIERDLHVGLSHGYKADQTAVGTTNCAGGRNLQLIVLANDDTVLHVMPGFWHPEDLVDELLLALDVFALHRERPASAETRDRLFQAMHRSRAARLSPATLARSEWQGFDRWHEMSRAQREWPRDTFEQTSAGGIGALKNVVQIVHERMAQRPFRKLADFDMEAFVDYGRPYYDNNSGHDKGRNFPRAVQVNKKRERAQEKAEKEAAKEAAKAQRAGD